MKQKISTSPVTKKDVENILDAKLKNYPTKHDMDERFSKFASAFRVENEFEHAQLKDDILDGVRKIVSSVMSAIDPLLQELEIRREHREIESDQMLKVRDELDDHGKRIKKLEQS